MNYERYAFPLVVFASLLTVWLVFRRNGPDQISSPADPVPINPYLPAPRTDPPATGGRYGPLPNSLRYPANLTPAAAVGEAGAPGAVTAGSFCCG